MCHIDLNLVIIVFVNLNICSIVTFFNIILIELVEQIQIKKKTCCNEINLLNISFVYNY